MADTSEVKLIKLKELIEMRYFKLKDEQKENVYFTHDNEGRPFKVTVDPKKKTLSVAHIKNSFKFNYNEPSVKISDYADNWITDLSYEKIFIGKGYKLYDEKTDESKIYYDGDWNVGNSILIQIKQNEYMKVGCNVIGFSTKEKITDLHSYVGNNDVVYSFAVSETYVYNLNGQKISIIKRSDIEPTINSTLDIVNIDGMSELENQMLLCPRLNFCTLGSMMC